MEHEANVFAISSSISADCKPHSGHPILESNIDWGKGMIRVF